MKHQFYLIAILTFLVTQVTGQSMGNVNYQHRVDLPQNVIDVPYPNNDEVLITVKGISNVKADNYVAIFSVTQAAESAKKVNKLIDKRIKPIKEYCKNNPDMSFYLDMISFVPLYETKVENKIFSEKTYKEVPNGFEIKKNLHIRYEEPEKLNEIITVAAESQIYELVRVDYFSDSLGQIKQNLMQQAKEVLADKRKYKNEILDVDLNTYDKQLSDGFTVAYPIEMYKEYQVASTNKIKVNNQKKKKVGKSQKNTTYHYKPYFNKDFDFAKNPTIVEPVIQVLYELKVKYIPPEEEKEAPQKQKTETKKDVIIITPSGQMKTIEVTE